MFFPKTLLAHQCPNLKAGKEHWKNFCTDVVLAVVIKQATGSSSDRLSSGLMLAVVASLYSDFLFPYLGRICV